MAEVKMPDNSHKARNEESQRVKKQAVVSSVKETKKPLGHKMLEVFIGDDIPDIKSYILFDVIVPAIKDGIEDTVSLILRGTAKPRRGSTYSRNGGATYVSYNQKFAGNPERRPEPKHTEYPYFLFDSRGEAERVLDAMLEVIDQFGQVTILDYYDLVGKTGDFTDKYYGWENLAKASVKRERGGYTIDLPRPVDFR